MDPGPSGSGPPLLNYKGRLHIPKGVEIKHDAFILGKDDNGVILPYMDSGRFIILKAMRRKEAPRDIKYKLLPVTHEEWLEDIADYAFEKRRPWVLQSARNTVEAYKAADHEIDEAAKLKDQRIQAFKLQHESMFKEIRENTYKTYIAPLYMAKQGVYHGSSYSSSD